MNNQKLLLLMLRITLLTHIPLTITMEPNKPQLQKRQEILNKLLFDECSKEKPLLSNISSFINQGANVNIRNNIGATPLHYASLRNNAALANLLITHGAHVDAQAYENVTPLYLASEEGNLNVATLLISKGANVNSKNIKGTTPLHQACEFGHFNIVKLLVQNKANVNAKNHSDITPLDVACDYTFFTIVDFLLKHGANIDTRSKPFELTPLHFACKHADTMIINLLLDNHSDINATTINGITPLFIAVAHNQIKNCKVLLQRGANPYLATTDGITPLDLAYDKNYKHIISLFKQYNVSTISEQQAEQNMLNFFKELAEEESQKKGPLAPKKRTKKALSKKIIQREEPIIAPLNSPIESTPPSTIETPLSQTALLTPTTITPPITAPLEKETKVSIKRTKPTPIAPAEKPTITTEQPSSVSKKLIPSSSNQNGYTILQDRQLKWPRSLHAKQKDLLKEQLKQLKLWPAHNLSNIKALKGSPNTYRLRLGSHRVIFSVNDNNHSIIIHSIGLRKNIYKNII